MFRRNVRCDVKQEEDERREVEVPVDLTGLSSRLDRESASQRSPCSTREGRRRTGEARRTISTRGMECMAWIGGGIDASGEAGWRVAISQSEASCICGMMRSRRASTFFARPIPEGRRYILCNYMVEWGGQAREWKEC